MSRAVLYDDFESIENKGKIRASAKVLPHTVRFFFSAFPCVVLLAYLTSRTTCCTDDRFNSLHWIVDVVPCHDEGCLVERLEEDSEVHRRRLFDALIGEKS